MLIFAYSCCWLDFEFISFIINCLYYFLKRSQINFLIKHCHETIKIMHINLFTYIFSMICLINFSVQCLRNWWFTSLVIQLLINIRKPFFKMTQVLGYRLLMLAKKWLHLQVYMRYFFIKKLINATNLTIKLLLLWIEPKLIDLLDVILHLIVAYFLLEHKLQVCSINLAFYHSFNISKSGSGLNIRCDLLHGLLDIIQIRFLI